ncbi:MAG: sigma 54-interacting transcriptional regulator [Nitrospirae bacterium]|nr:sigma 54-interacting transcriptional regulator [Nitrospirota bacterium]
MKAKLLVIDDEEGIRFTFKRFLLDEGYAVATANNFDEALAKITETDFDLIFADIILQGKTGVDVLRGVRERNLNCPVIMITGYPNIESASEAMRLGAFDYITKPVQKETLLHVANMALQHKAITDEKEKYRSNLEAIFRSVHDAIITVDKELVVLEINEMAKNICGFSREDIGRVFSSSPEMCNRKCLEVLTRTIKQKEPMEENRLECQIHNRPQQVVTLTASPLIDSKGIFSGAVMVVRDETRLANLEQDLKERQQFHNIIGKSEQMQKVFSLVEALADVQTTVLITGESGTGKELVAEALHYNGTRSSKPLVKVNCSALSENLLESELFGHVKGAFTGAVKDKIGRFQRADGGTIFLDEIADISQGIQLRLLRVLQDMEFECVGDSVPVKVDVRVVAATNQNLKEKVRLGKFREDLYYRLKVVEIPLPALREKLEDMPLLVDYFLKKFNKKLNKEIRGISIDVQRIFMNYNWSGNVRELEHALEHAYIVCHQNTITVDDLPLELKSFNETTAPALMGKEDNGAEAIRNALEKTAGNKAKAARLIGISRQTIYRKIKELKIRDEI